MFAIFKPTKERIVYFIVVAIFFFVATEVLHFLSSFLHLLQDLRSTMANCTGGVKLGLPLVFFESQEICSSDFWGQDQEPSFTIYYTHLVIDLVVWWVIATLLADRRQIKSSMADGISREEKKAKK
jgi:hypothetical protein